MMNHVTGLQFLTSTRDILGVQVSDFSLAEALSVLRVMAEMPVGQTKVAFLNANNANLTVDNPGYREVLAKQLVLPDGHGVDIASYILTGSAFPANLNGTDFVPAWLTYMAEPKKIGLIGARPHVLKLATERFRKHSPWHEFVALSDGYMSDEQSLQLMQTVEPQKFDILIVAMGSPRQEKWIETFVKPEHARVVVSVGALFDFMAGEVPRAPKWMRDLRVEWMFRLYQEPARLWKRYVIGNPLFLCRVLARRLQMAIDGRKRPASKTRISTTTEGSAAP